MIFDNSTDEASKYIFLAWAILGSILVIYYLSVLLLKKYRGLENGKSSVALSVLVALFLGGTTAWWYGLFFNNTSSQLQAGFVPFRSTK